MRHRITAVTRCITPMTANSTLPIVASSEPMKTVKSESAISTVCTHVPRRFCAPRKQ